MNNFNKITYFEQTKVSNIGPWVLRNKTDNEQTWNIVVSDWQNLFSDFIQNDISNKTLVIQAGGWQGLYPRLLSEVFDTVYTFEPDSVNFNCLSQNCRKDNIYKFQAALGEECGVAVFEEVTSTGQGRVQHQNAWNMTVQKTYNVPVLSIDSLNVSDCGLIMLDVESFEFPVLLGAIKTIRKFKPIIITEKNFRKDDNTHMIDLMKSLGYIIKIEYPNDIIFSPVP